MNRRDDALDVIDFGVAIARDRQENADSTETRQQLAAGALPLFELLAVIYAAADASAAFIERLELARAQNLYGWLTLQEKVEACGTDSAVELFSHTGPPRPNWRLAVSAVPASPPTITFG